MSAILQNFDENLRDYYEPPNACKEVQRPLLSFINETTVEGDGMD